MKSSGRQKTVVFLLGVLFCFVLLLGTMILFGKRPENPVETKKIQIVPKAQVSISQMEQILQKNGITQWKLRADSAILIQKKNKAVLKKVDVIFYAQDGQKIFLTSDRGELDTQTKDINLSGNVVVRRGKATAKTHSLHYEKKHHILSSNSTVHFTNGDCAVQADSMTIELTENRLLFLGHVTGRLYEIFHRP